MHSQFSTNSSIPKFVFEMAAIAKVETLGHFRTKLDISNKIEVQKEDDPDHFDPVTIADRNAEKALRHYINFNFPDHGILGEEFGGENIDADYVWVLDPIDGTRAFISGIPVWGTLIALCFQNKPIFGMMVQPFIDEIFVGDGRTSWLAKLEDCGKSAQRINCRKVEDIEVATMLITSPHILNKTERLKYDEIEKKCQLFRYGLDCYAYVMTAAGFADCVIEAGLQVYDIAALIPIIEGAGGIVTNWQGEPIEAPISKNDRLQVVACGNKILHEKLILELS